MEKRRNLVQRPSVRVLRAGAATLLALATLPAFACRPPLKGEGAHLVEGKTYVVAWRADPAPLRVGEFFAVEMAVCANAGAAPETVRVDAAMPEHKHGMNYKPTVQSVGAGQFRAEGLMLHMPGKWDISFDARGKAGDEVMHDSVLLK